MRGGGGKAWLLTIVRNAFYDWVSRNRPAEIIHDGGRSRRTRPSTSMRSTPSRPRCANPMRASLADALATLPLQFREAIVLRELEDLSYRDIARVIDVPIGTVMSRLARGRAMLRRMPSLQPVQEIMETRRQS